MELYKELLIAILKDEHLQITFPELMVDLNMLLASRCYLTLCQIRGILADDTLDDPECFAKIEEIVSAFEALGSCGGSRHDF